MPQFHITLPKSLVTKLKYEADKRLQSPQMFLRDFLCDYFKVPRLEKHNPAHNLPSVRVAKGLFKPDPLKRVQCTVNLPQETIIDLNHKAAHLGTNGAQLLFDILLQSPHLKSLPLETLEEVASTRKVPVRPLSGAMTADPNILRVRISLPTEWKAAIEQYEHDTEKLLAHFIQKETRTLKITKLPKLNAAHGITQYLNPQYPQTKYQSAMSEFLAKRDLAHETVAPI